MTGPEPERLVLSQQEVDALVDELRLHRISARNPLSCTCGEGWKCARRRLAESRLTRAGRGADILRAMRTPRISEPVTVDWLDESPD